MTQAPVKSVRLSSVVYCALSFSFVIVTPQNSLRFWNYYPAGLLIAAMWEPVVLVFLTPFVILFVAVFIRSIFWRNAIFIIGLLALTFDWFLMVRLGSSRPLFSTITSLPYLVVVSYWMAVSVNGILRREKRNVIAQKAVHDLESKAYANAD